MNVPKYSIGDQVWRATWDTEKVYVPCPDCGGTKSLLVTLFDDTTYKIDCTTCSPGFMGPQGRISRYKRLPRAKLATISGMELGRDKIEYKCEASSLSDDGQTYTAHYIISPDDIFDTEAEAETAAIKLAERGEADELARLQKKEKPARDWAWHVSYHRQCAKRAEKELAYHTSKLQVAKIKAKEPVA